MKTNVLGGMALDLETGCFQGVPFLPSPNCDERSTLAKIDLLVIHGICLPPDDLYEKSHIISFFSNKLDPTLDPYFEIIKDLKVSAHLCIFRDGTVIQFVPLIKRAWHAGVSEFEGRSACNDFSIGIELQGRDIVPYTEAQYETLGVLTRLIREIYPAITLDRIVGHSDIAPVRKTDPGVAFDWHYFKRKLID